MFLRMTYNVAKYQSIIEINKGVRDETSQNLFLKSIELYVTQHFWIENQICKCCINREI